MFRPLLLLLLAATVVAVDKTWDASRSYLDRLTTKKRVKEGDFEYPFLFTLTAMKTPFPVPELVERVRAFLADGKLAFPGHFPKPGTPTSPVIELPAALTKGKQLEAVNECNTEKCLVKLNNEKEKKQIATSKRKLDTYKEIIEGRIASYLSKQELMGYEDRENNASFIKKMLEEFEFPRKRYAGITQFLKKDFWSGQAPALVGPSFLRQALVSIAPDRLQPIWRIGEVFEFPDCAPGSVFVELHVYSNHYMDSSLRLIEACPWESVSVVIVTDIMEIDELTKSGLIRMLYKGKMEDAVSEAQDQDLHKILRSNKI